MTNFKAGEVVAALGRAFVCVGRDPDDPRRVLVRTLDGAECLSFHALDLVATGYAVKE